ncbi:MAG: radical SAM protein [Candidatus Diapherotrites archaeon]
MDSEKKIIEKKDTKIEFLIPPKPYLGDEMRNPELGIMYLAAVTLKEGYNVVITDLRCKAPEEFSKHIGKSDVYALTATTPDYLAAKKIAEIAKSKNKNSWAIIGGIHATSVPNKIDPIFDKIGIGEGENTILEILNDFRKGNNEKRFYQSDLIKDLDSIPFPARDMLPFENVFSANGLFVGAGPTATVITSRGCPFNCAFCASKKMWQRRLRLRTPENVVKEIKYIIEKYNVKNFRFHDDTITARKDWIKEVCEKIKPFKIRWRAGTRVDQITEEILQLMKDAGCEEISYGVESLDPNVIEKINKGIKIEDVKSAIKIAKKVGMQVRTFFIIGLPGEKLGYADRLIQFCDETNPDAVDVSTLVPFPGCDIHDNMQTFGLEMDEEDFKKYIMTLGLGKEEEMDADFIFKHDVMSNEELKEERKKSLEYIKSRKMVKNF